MITTKRVEMFGQSVEVRPLTWGELKKLEKDKKAKKAKAEAAGANAESELTDSDVLLMVCPEVDQDRLNAPLVTEATRVIWALTNGTDAQLGNLSSTGDGTPPTPASTAATSATATDTPASA